MLNLVTSFYISKYSSDINLERTNELCTALQKNIDSIFIKKIHLFVDDDDAMEKILSLNNLENKIKIINIGKKPLYSDIFKYIIENLKDELCMVSNSDIYIHDCNIKLLNLLKENKLAYTLTRHEYDMSDMLISDYRGSHDCYIFNSVFLNKSIINNLNYVQNLPGIETRIITELYRLDFKILNPCKQIKIVHLHKTNLRNYLADDWVGFHKSGDFIGFLNSCSFIPPINISIR